MMFQAKKVSVKCQNLLFFDIYKIWILDSWLDETFVSFFFFFYTFLDLETNWNNSDHVKG